MVRYLDNPVRNDQVEEEINITALTARKVDSSIMPSKPTEPIMARAASLAKYALVSRPRKGGVLYADLEFQRKAGGLKKTLLLNSVTGVLASGNDSTTLNYSRGVIWNRTSNNDVSVTTQKVGTVIVQVKILAGSSVPHDQRLAVLQESIAILQAQADLLVDGITETGGFDVPNGTVEL